MVSPKETTLEITWSFCGERAYVRSETVSKVAIICETYLFEISWNASLSEVYNKGQYVGATKSIGFNVDAANQILFEVVLEKTMDGKKMNRITKWDDIKPINGFKNDVHYHLIFQDTGEGFAIDIKEIGTKSTPAS